MIRSLVLGIGGQDGSYLAELLLERGHEVVGLVRRSSADNLFRVRHLLDRLTLVEGDLTDRGSLANALAVAMRRKGPHVVPPDVWVWNMADQDHVGHSFAAPRVSVDVTYGGVANLLEVIGRARVRVFQPLSITMFGPSPAPQHEGSQPDPQSPYACAKVAAWMLCRYHRVCYATDVRCAIFANHDSPRRQGNYLLHRLCREALEVRGGTRGMVQVPSLNTVLDVSFAGDLMQDALSIMSLPEPDDFVLGGDYRWRADFRGDRPACPTVGTVLTDVAEAAGIDKPLEAWVSVDARPHRPGPQAEHVADCRKARSTFPLAPRKPVKDLVREIVDKYRSQP